MIVNHCHARRCVARIPDTAIMCEKHWLMAPVALRKLLHVHYVSDAAQSADYFAVVGALVNAVDMLEQKEAGTHVR